MKIDQIRNTSTNAIEIRNNNLTKNGENTKAKLVDYEDKFIKSENSEDVITYNKKGASVSKNQIQQLKDQSELAYSKLRELVNQILNEQKTQYENSKEMIEISPELRIEAQRLIASDGEMGIEAASNRIVEFAIAISGGDKLKLEELKGYITQGFKEAESTLGSLPEISHKTYEATINKINEWAKD